MKSKRVEVRLSLPVVAPLLDVIKAASDQLQHRLAATIELDGIEPEFRDTWRAELIATQNEDIGTLLALFDSEFFSSGIIAFDEKNAEPILRASAAVRLCLREQFLVGLSDELLETGDVEFEDLEEPVRKAFKCYVFLATVQELIIQHLDGSILDA